MFSTPTYAPAQLMHLSQTKTLARFNDHNRSIGYIYTHFNYRCCYHNLRFTTNKTRHFIIFVVGFHLAVYNCHAVIRQRKMTHNGFVSLHQVLVIHRLRFLNQRIHKVNLTTQFDLLFHKTKNAQTLRFAVVYRFDRLATRRQFIYYRNIQIAVKGESQSSRNRRGCHHQNMRRQGVFSIQFRPLRNAKTMLFINHGITQIQEFHFRFNEGMRTH